MFGAKMWPKSATAWTQYDKDRDEAVKDIENAREMRGWGQFDLSEYLARAQGKIQIQSHEPGPEGTRKRKQLQDDKPDPEVPVLGKFTPGFYIVPLRPTLTMMSQ